MSTITFDNILIQFPKSLTYTQHSSESGLTNGDVLIYNSCDRIDIMIETGENMLMVKIALIRMVERNENMEGLPIELPIKSTIICFHDYSNKYPDVDYHISGKFPCFKSTFSIYSWMQSDIKPLVINIAGLIHENENRITYAVEL